MSDHRLPGGPAERLPGAPAERPPTLLEVREVTKAFGGLMALQDVSLRVRSGQIKALIGPNGAGKTTLFNLIAGVFPPTAGQITFRRQSIVGLRPHQVAALGVVRTFQNVQVFGSMTVLENVLVGLHRHMHSGLLDAAVRSARMREEERALGDRARRLLDGVGLSAWADVAADSLPFGLQRAVEISRALAAEPSLLLLDEPGAGLSATEKGRIRELVRRIRDGGMTVFLVEHDMELVMGLADEVAVLDQGILIAEGAPAVIQQDPRVIGAYLGEAEPVHAP